MAFKGCLIIVNNVIAYEIRDTMINFPFLEGWSILTVKAVATFKSFPRLIYTKNETIDTSIGAIVHIDCNITLLVRTLLIQPMCTSRISDTRRTQRSSQAKNLMGLICIDDGFSFRLRRKAQCQTYSADKLVQDGHLFIPNAHRTLGNLRSSTGEEGIQWPADAKYSESHEGRPTHEPVEVRR